MTDLGQDLLPAKETWLDKYQPQNLADVLGDKEKIQRVEKFIKQFIGKKKSITYPNLIITGANGIGKTIIVNLVLKQYGFEKINADLSSISITRKSKRKNKAEKETTGNNRTAKTYYISLNNRRTLLSSGKYVHDKVALVFDDVSNISNPKEKEAIKSLVRINNKLKRLPIIIIANTKHSKTMNEIRKMVTYNDEKLTDNKDEEKSVADGHRKKLKFINEIALKAPEYSQLEKLIKYICQEEGLKIVRSRSDEEDIYVELVNHSQYDVRRLINILEELHFIYGKAEVTLDVFNEYRDTSKMKVVDYGIFEATRVLLNSYQGVESSLLLYGQERATIPMMVHENYPLNIKNQYPKMPVEDQVELIYQISKSISESDKIDGIIYSNQCWNLQPEHGFYSCVLPSYYINQRPDKLSNIENYRYTQEYNKTSIRKINNKVIKKAKENQSLKKVSTYDFLYIASILKTLLEKKDLEKVAELMKPYGLTVKEIESIIKIDKIKKSKSIITGKQKTILEKLMDVDD